MPGAVPAERPLASATDFNPQALLATCEVSFVSKFSDLTRLPDARGHFGPYGGRFVSETLSFALDELEKTYLSLRDDPDFQAEFDYDLAHYVGRPSPLYHAERWSKQLGGAQIWLKREDLNHTGAHKVNNTIGQALLAKKSGKPRVIAETGAGQHGVASATVAARLGLKCDVYMGAEDIQRQKLNVYRMRLLGANVISVESGTRTLKDAMNEALRDWVTNVDDTFYIIGTVAGPHPYPMLVRDFNAVVGREARRQSFEEFGRLPDALIACVGGGSNAMGMFTAFLEDESVHLVGVEPAGEGLDTQRHSATLTLGKPGEIHGMACYVLEDEAGNPMPVHSIASGLDYPGVGPQHSYLKEIGRVDYQSASDDECLEAFLTLSRVEGIIPALESAHAVAWAMREAPKLPADQHILVNLSGRGDKDADYVANKLGL